jgi:hypothetical protein
MSAATVKAWKGPVLAISLMKHYNTRPDILDNQWLQVLSKGHDSPGWLNHRHFASAIDAPILIGPAFFRDSNEIFER